MALKTFKPYTKSTRGTVIASKKNLWKGKPIKMLTVGKKSSSGRNNLGRITSRRRGSGHKQKYRKKIFIETNMTLKQWLRELSMIRIEPAISCCLNI